MKKLFCLILALCLVLPLIACAKEDPQVTTTAPTTTSASLKDVPLYIGVLYPGKVDEKSTGTYSIHEDLKKAMRRRGLDEDLGVFVEELVPEVTKDVLAAVDRLVDAGAVLIFGTALGYNEGLAQAADKYPEIIFCQMGGTNGNESNFATYFAPLYQAYFMLGGAAAVKAQELECTDIGFVCTSGKETPEAASIINAFARGVQVFLPDATVHLKVLEPGATEAMEMDAVDELFQNHGCQVFSSFTHTAGTLKQAYNLKLFATGPWFTDENLAPDPKDGHEALLVSPQVRWFPYFMAAIKAAEACNTADEFFMAMGSDEFYGTFAYESYIDHKFNGPDSNDSLYFAEVDDSLPYVMLAMGALDPGMMFDIDVRPPTEQYPTGTVVTVPSPDLFGPFAGYLYTVKFYDTHAFSISNYEAAMADTAGNIRIPAGSVALELDLIREMDYYIMGIELA